MLLPSETRPDPLWACLMCEGTWACVCEAVCLYLYPHAQQTPAAKMSQDFSHVLFKLCHWAIVSVTHCLLVLSQEKCLPREVKLSMPHGVAGAMRSAYEPGSVFRSHVSPGSLWAPRWNRALAQGWALVLTPSPTRDFPCPPKALLHLPFFSSCCHLLLHQLLQDNYKKGSSLPVYCNLWLENSWRPRKPSQFPSPTLLKEFLVNHSSCH